jgi:hypothetical protein
MKHKIIKTDNYLVVVDDSEIKVGDWYYLPRTNSVYECKEDPTELNLERRVGVSNVIVHHPLNGAPHLDGVDLLPPLEDENELLEIDYLERLEERRNIALNFKGQVAGRHPDNFTKSEMYHMSRGYVEGYQDARKKYQFTEEDIDKAYWAGMKFVGEDKGSYKEFIQSLQQLKLPIAFKCEIVFASANHAQALQPTGHPLMDVAIMQNFKPKTIINSEGRKEWVGKWIYE